MLNSRVIQDVQRLSPNRETFWRTFQAGSLGARRNSARDSEHTAGTRRFDIRLFKARHDFSGFYLFPALFALTEREFKPRVGELEMAFDGVNMTFCRALTKLGSAGVILDGDLQSVYDIPG
jgi:hypothetical protein